MSSENRMGVRDASLEVSKTLPAAASTAANSGSIDLQGAASKEDFVARVDLEIASPALTTGELPDAKTITYKVETSADDSTYVALYDTVLVVTGAGGIGASAEKEQVPLRGRINGTSGNLRRYVRVVATTGAGTGDCSGSTFKARLVA